MAYDDKLIPLPNGMKAARNGLGESYVDELLRLERQNSPLVPPVEPRSVGASGTFGAGASGTWGDPSGISQGAQALSGAVDRFAQSSVPPAPSWDGGGVVPALGYAARGAAQTLGSPIQTGEALVGRIRGNTADQQRQALTVPGAELTQAAREELQRRDVEAARANQPPAPTPTASAGGPGVGGSGVALPRYSNTGELLTNQGFTDQAAALQEVADAQGAEGTARARLRTEGMAADEARDAALAAKIAPRKVEEDKLSTAANAAREELAIREQVDPDSHWARKTTGGKIMAGLAVALSGIGSTIAGRGASGADGAIKILNDAMEQDLTIQRQNIGLRKEGRTAKAEAAKGKLDAYQRATGDLIAANALAKADYWKKIDNQIAAMADANLSATARANANLLAGKAKIEQGKAVGEFNERRAKLAQDNARIALDARRTAAQELESGAKAAKDMKEAKAAAASQILSLPQNAQQPMSAMETNWKSADQSIKQLQDLVTKFGTAEITGTSEGDMKALISSLTTAVKKIEDPGSTVTKADEASMQERLFQAGKAWQLDSSALSKLGLLRKDIDLRRNQAWNNYSMTPPGAQVATPPTGFKPAP